MVVRQVINCANAEIKKYIDDIPYLFIMFTDSDDLNIDPSIIDNSKGFLLFKINDIVIPNNIGRCFGPANALAISNFLRYRKFIASKIIISCPTGISRSGAVAAAIQEYFNPKISSYNPLYHNNLIYCLTKKYLDKTIRNKFNKYIKNKKNGIKKFFNDIKYRLSLKNFIKDLH